MKSMKIPLTQNFVAVIDARDFKKISNHKWCAHKTKNGVYAAARQRPFYLLMHRIIIGAKPGEIVDHWDFDTLNNRRSNLRKCTHSQSMRHRRKIQGRTSKYKGVHRNRQAKRWEVQMRLGPKSKNTYLGGFSTEVEAAKFYDKMAKRYHGRFAVLNFE